jgi:hypothetical protein
MRAICDYTIMHTVISIVPCACGRRVTACASIKSNSGIIKINNRAMMYGNVISVINSYASFAGQIISFKSYIAY